MKDKALLIDPYSHGSYHEVINQSYLMMLMELYQDIEYIADKSSCNNLRMLLEKCKVNYDHVKFNKRKVRKVKCKRGGIQYILKLISVSFLDYYYYMKSKDDCDVFYNNNVFYGILFMQWFSFWKKNNIYIMCHNEMEWINKNIAIGGGARLVSKLLNFVFKKIKLSSRFHFILLSSDMVDYFRNFIISDNFDRIYAMDHSYIRPDNLIKEIDFNNDNLKIGLPGAINSQRGLDLLKKIINDIQKSNISIYSISTISEVIKNEHLIILNRNNKLMSFEQYNAYVKSMDVLLFLYDIDSYKLTASGAILEAIWNEKPIIALKNSYFNYLFEKFGRLGILCDSEDQLKDELIRFPTSIDIYDIKTNIRTAKKYLLPKYVKEQLKAILLK